jgi:DNA excision repair protein ERCC-5
LNDFFDITGGSGTYAPRNRQAYASKRLQQVVNDFRSKRKRGFASPAPSSRSQSGSESEKEPVPTKKKKTAADKGKGNARASTSRREKGGARARGGGSPWRPKQTMGSSTDDEFEGTKEPQQEFFDNPPDPVVVARLRPRPKPAYRGAQTSSADVNTSSAGGP